MKPCTITSRSFIIARLPESNKTADQIYSVQYLVICVYYFIVFLSYYLRFGM